MKGWTIFIALLMVWAGCKQQSGKKGSVQAMADTASFYPIANFIHEQIEETDLQNLPRTLRYTSNQTIRTNKLGRDSFLLLSGLFNSILTQFSHEKQLYKESILHDLSTSSYTLTYQPLQPEQATFEYADILLNDQNRQVKRINIQRTYEIADTSVTEHLSWRTNKGFLISRTKTDKAGIANTEVIEVSWKPEKNTPL
ncbi:MAG: hypothetical protein NTZ47_07965 [Bacteroidetes bacterium]|nr:hypothetical protein [Bacteroidota bacterium]